MPSLSKEIEGFEPAVLLGGGVTIETEAANDGKYVNNDY